MSTTAITETMVICDEGEYGATPHRRNRYCVNPRECVVAPQPAPDAEGADLLAELDQWVEVTGCVPFGGSWHAEMKSFLLRAMQRRASTQEKQ